MDEGGRRCSEWVAAVAGVSEEGKLEGGGLASAGSDEIKPPLPARAAALAMG